MGYVFQKDTVFPWRTVAQNIALGLQYRGVATAEIRSRVTEAVALAGLEGFEDAFPATLSGGMRQRVALMRSLVVNPEILLMDEPFGALDTHTKLNLHAELLSLWGARQQTVVFVTHDLSEAITLADRIVVMTRRPGRVKLVYDVKLPRPRDVIAPARDGRVPARVRRDLARARRGIPGAASLKDGRVERVGVAARHPRGLSRGLGVPDRHQGHLEDAGALLDRSVLHQPAVRRSRSASCT